MGKNQEMLTKWRMADQPGHCDVCRQWVPRHWAGVTGPCAGVVMCPECQFEAAAEEVLGAEALTREVIALEAEKARE